MTKIIKGTNSVSSQGAAQAKLLRYLIVGFYHGIGRSDMMSDGPSASEYRFGWKGPQVGRNPQGNFVWEPKASNIAKVTPVETMAYNDLWAEFNTKIGGEKGGGATLHRGEHLAAHWKPEYEQGNDWGEEVKKQMLPQVAWNEAEWGGENLSLGDFGQDKNDQKPEDAAKRYVWKWIRSKWNTNAPPRGDALGIFVDYMHRIRQEGSLEFKAQAGIMLNMIMKDYMGRMMSTGGSKEAFQQVSAVTQEPPTGRRDRNIRTAGAGSGEELALRLWPFIKPILQADMSGNKDMTTVLDEASAAFRAAGEPSRINPPGGEGFDIDDTMAIWKHLEDEFASVAGFKLRAKIEVTEQVNRIASRYKGRQGLDRREIDFGDPQSREQFANWIDREITTEIMKSFEARGPPTTKQAAGYHKSHFEQVATRRYWQVFGTGGGSYTWIEPVTGGIGLYTVLMMPRAVALTSPKDLVTVSVHFLPSPQIHIAERLLESAKVKHSYKELRDTIEASFRGGIFRIWNHSYRTKYMTTPKLNVGDSVGGWHRRPIVATQASIVTQGELTKALFEWASQMGWEQALYYSGEGLPQGEQDSQPQGKFKEWTERVYDQIQDFGQEMGDRLAPPKFQSWVRDDEGGLTKTKPTALYPESVEYGTPRSGGAGDVELLLQLFGRGGQEGQKSGPQFYKYLDGNRPYQPKPFIWMRGGVK